MKLASVHGEPANPKSAARPSKSCLIISSARGYISSRSATPSSRSPWISARSRTELSIRTPPPS